jgi:hypothetical protein
MPSYIELAITVDEEFHHRAQGSFAVLLDKKLVSS